MKKILASVLCAAMAFCTTEIFALGKSKKSAEEKSVEKSGREISAEEKMSELYVGAKVPREISQSELYGIVNNLIYGELYQQGKLSDKEREMISLATLATLGTVRILKIHVYTSLNAGLSAEEITETIFHCTPYIGAAKALEAVAAANEVFAEKKIGLPESSATVTEESRFDDGKAAQTKLFGDLGDRKPADGETRLGRSFLPDYCFGDFYTRTGISLEQHELLTWVCIAALGGAEGQLTGHTAGNKNVGRSKEFMMEVVTDMMPFIGYPRTLNALSIIENVYGK